MDDDTNEVRIMSSILLTTIENTNNPFSTGFTYSTHRTSMIAISPDGKWIAFGGWDKTVQVCELVEGGKHLTYQGHQDLVHALAWSPDGTLLASAGNGQASADLQIWEPTTGQSISLTQYDETPIMSVAWSLTIGKAECPG